ncbi:unnamed protein product [Leptosia nina]|uniref:Reverse transcriptase n=2 Tax=Leptosia nina TaxID=320188 RepID=A0AAV1JXK1_9NEOP
MSENNSLTTPGGLNPSHGKNTVAADPHRILGADQTDDISQRPLAKCTTDKSNLQMIGDTSLELVAPCANSTPPILGEIAAQAVAPLESDSADSMVSRSSGRIMCPPPCLVSENTKGRFWRNRKRIRKDEGSSSDSLAASENRSGYCKARRMELEDRAEVDLLSFNSATGDDTGLDVQKRIVSNLEVVERVAGSSRNLKGTFVAALRKAAREIKEDAGKLADRTLTDETSALRAENERLRVQLDVLQKEMRELRALIQSGAKDAAPVQCLEDFEAKMMRQIGNMINARLEGLEPRLNPVVRLRPPLAVDRINEKKKVGGSAGPVAQAILDAPQSKMQKKKKNKKKMKALHEGVKSVVVSTTVPSGTTITPESDDVRPSNVVSDGDWVVVARKGPGQGVAPWYHEAAALADVYWKRAQFRRVGGEPTREHLSIWQEEGRETTILLWKDELANSRVGVWTIEAILPVFDDWLNRRWGTLSYRLTQGLTGHGCYGSYLYKVVRREPSPICHRCGCPEDTPQHTWLDCPAWCLQRRTMFSIIGLVQTGGNTPTLSTLVRIMLQDESRWRAVKDFCEEIFAIKESDERARELDPLASEVRRRRERPRRVLR